MHQRERHMLILNTLAERGLTPVSELARICGASQPTIRRDIVGLAATGQLVKVHGGAEPVANQRRSTQDTGAPSPLSAPVFRHSETINYAQKRAIAREAVALCQDGESIIVNGGTTTYRMVEFLADRHLQILTNSFQMAADLVAHSENRIILPGGEVYRDQNIILSPFGNDTTQSYYASKVFMGARGIGPQGMMEADPLLIQAEQKLINQAGRFILMVDSSKFHQQSALILCPLDRIDAVITDDGIDRAARKMLSDAGIDLVVATVSEEDRGAFRAA
ncbi:DeoR/GlpR family DNA-binding transcription regulator [Fodinicurvata sp. EGI_FJ10296]|uniref:DeoR/GlpR family DNA-binding transcription regulator n=1 Tax=Fodinicurvata sp. EGI_FJ10296 TaxID=3231908 RepID=UPI00345345C0